jgi:hypothetical protein
MSIQVTGNARPGRPALAIAVSGVLLAGTLLGAAGLTYVRNRPVPLKPVQDVRAIPGLRMAWPDKWNPAPVPPRAGPVVAGVAQPSSSQGQDKVLYLLTERVSNSYVSPRYAAPHVLQSAARQLRIAALSEDFLVSPDKLAGQPAFQIEYQVHLQRRVYWAVLRVASEPDGSAMGLLLLSSEQMSPATKRILDQVASSMQLKRLSFDMTEAMAGLKLTARSDDVALASLRGYPQELPVAGTVGMTFVPEGPSGGQPYAIDLWTSWLSNRRTLQDMAGTWFRRLYLQADPPTPGEWVQRAGVRVWKLALARSEDGNDNLVETLYLKELPDRRVLWAHTIAASDTDPEDTVLNLLTSAQPAEKTGWDYDAAVASSAKILADLAGERVGAYYRANMGRQRFVFTAVDGRDEGAGVYTTAVQPDGTLTRHEQVDIGPEGEILKSERMSLLRSDLSNFQVNDTTIRRQDTSLRIKSGRADAGSPIAITMQFGRHAPIDSSFLTREPFLPDPALEPAALLIARKPGTVALFRTVGMDPEVPESVLLTGRGKQRVEVAGRSLDALVCVIQEDTSTSPNLALFDNQGRLIGYIFQGGATLLRSTPAAQTEPAGAE